MIKSFFSTKKSSQENNTIDIDAILKKYKNKLALDEYALEKIKAKNFNFIPYLNDEALKNSPVFKKLVRQVLGKNKGRLYVYDVTYQEKRQFDSISYDYKYTHYKVYLDENDQWDEEFQNTTYSQDFED